MDDNNQNSHNQANFITSSHITKSKAFGLLVAAFLFLKVFSLLFAPQAQMSLASDLTPANILNAVNYERSLYNLTTLNTNSELGEAAQGKTDDMQARHYFAHIDPDGHYIWDKIVADGYTPYSMLGENLAIEFYDTDSLMSAWMNSPDHRANILQEGFRDQGMGVTLGDVQAGQYHSAIANTFGALAIAKRSAPVPAAPKPAAPKPSPAAAPAQAKPTAKTQSQPVASGAGQSPQATSTPSAYSTSTIQNFSTPEQGLQIRGSQTVAQSSFALPTQIPVNASPTPPEQPAMAVVGNPNSTVLTDYQTNRYLILFCGALLLLLMLSDIKKAVDKKFASLDKKLNNFVILFISLVIIAFMYWL